MMTIRIDRAKGEIAQALAWWLTLTRLEKLRWLQSEATTEEIDAYIASPHQDLRAAATYGAVGDAWAAYRKAQGLPVKGRGISVVTT